MEVRILCLEEIIDYEHEIKHFLQMCFDNTYDVDDVDLIVSEKYESLKQHVNLGDAIPIGVIDGKKMLGFLWGYVIKGINGDAFHIGYIAVSESAQGKGIGATLIKFAEKEAKSRNVYNIELVVGAENHSARRFYNTNGFMENRIVMNKMIK